MKDSGWKDKYLIKKCLYEGSDSDGFDSGVFWYVASSRWSSAPRNRIKKISPYFSNIKDAREWIQSRWDKHVVNKMERTLGLKD